MEHMETFFFMVTARNQNNAIEMRRLQKALNYAQAKMHRTAATLETLGWINITASAEDARQKEVSITASGKEFFGKLGQFLSTEERTSTFQKRSREMYEEIQQQAQHREAVRNLYDNEAAEKSARILAEIADKAELERLNKRNAFGVIPKANQEVSERNERKSYVNQRLKERRLEQANFIKERKASRMMLRDVIMSREETCEIGEKYIKTERGIVTFPVLMKRTKATDLKTLAILLGRMDDEEFDRTMTPSPKTKLAARKAELESILQYGWESIEGNRHLFQRAHVLQSEIAAIEAKSKQGIGSLAYNPVTKDAWMALVEKQAKTANPDPRWKSSADMRTKKIPTGLLDPESWKEKGE